MKIYSLPPDKAQHWFYGSLIGSIVTILVLLAHSIAIPYYPEIQAFLGIIVVAIVAAAKEQIYDKLMGMGTPEIMDFVATLGGGLTVSVPLMVMYYAK